MANSLIGAHAVYGLVHRNAALGLMYVHIVHLHTMLQYYNMKIQYVHTCIRFSLKTITFVCILSIMTIHNSIVVVIGKYSFRR